jgi:hypothetical protein
MAEGRLARADVCRKIGSGFLGVLCALARDNHFSGKKPVDIKQ